ncbi:DUF5711 family protein [Roseburia hominis]
MGVIIEVRDPQEDLEEKIKTYKKQTRRKKVLAVLTLLAAVVSTYLLVALQTYDKVRVVRSYGEEAVDNSSFVQYSDGALKYSRDGIAFLDTKGQEKWNQPYQIKNPIINISGDAVAVGDQGGNDILVFDKKGLKGEIHTNFPIEKIVVAENGIVCALLRNESTPQIVCYDAMGSVLVEHKASISTTGYPVGMAISPDGTKLQISYLCVADGVQASRVVYFNFEEAGADKDQYQVTEDIYKNTVIPETFFLNSRKSVLVGDTSFMIYSGEDKPKLTKTVELGKEIRSVFHDERYLGFVLHGEGEEGYELRLYSMSGEQKLSKNFTGDYNHIKISRENVIMFDGKQCLVFSSWGVRKFEGELETDILEMIPLSGINKYLVMSASGMDEIRFVK